MLKAIPKYYIALLAVLTALSSFGQEVPVVKNINLSQFNDTSYWVTESFDLFQSFEYDFQSAGDWQIQVIPGVNQRIENAFDDDQIETSELVHPNPSYGEFIITHNEHYQFNVVTLNGKLVYSGNSNLGKTSINLGDVDAGVYLLRVITSSSIVTKRLIIKSE